MIEVAVYNDQQHEQFFTTEDRFGLRRSATGPESWFFVSAGDPQQHGGEIDFLIVDGTVVVQSRQPGLTIETSDGRELTAGRGLSMPCRLHAGATWIEIAQATKSRNLEPLVDVETIDLLASGSSEDQPAGPASTTIASWLAQAGQLHRAAAGSSEFYDDAARFAVNAVGLDGAWVLGRTTNESGEHWQIVGSYLPHPEQGIGFDSGALGFLKQQAVAWFQPAADEASTNNQNRQSVVVAPVLDAEGEVAAAIYGVRHTQGDNRRCGVRPLEARLVQLLAESVAVGIARIEQETAAARARALLEQAFSPRVVDYLQRHPESLSGQLCEVTLLFADLRNFTTLAETMSPADCYELLGDVMELLTQIVTQQEGVVVDYYGDGLLAFWNAPQPQSNHADLACSAGCQMLDALPATAEKWQKRLGVPLELGIGIHSGPALVGNAGTRSRLKYGPRGNTVNVASRVQAASKQLQLPLVLTSATQTKLSSDFFTLRVCTAKLPGLEQPAELHTAYPATEAWRIKSRLDQYSRALMLFEEGDLEASERLLDELVSFGQATPAHFLSHYATAQRNSNLGRRAVDKYAALPGPIIEIFGK